MSSQAGHIPVGTDRASFIALSSAAAVGRWLLPLKLSGHGRWLSACLVPAHGRPGARHHGAAHVLEL